MEVQFKERFDTVAHDRFEVIEITYEKGKLVLWANRQVEYNDLLIPKFYRAGFSLTPTRTEMWLQVEKDLCIIHIAFPRLNEQQARQLNIFFKENNFGVLANG